MTSSAATTFRQQLDALKPQVLAVATRHGASNMRIYGSIATGREHAASAFQVQLDVACPQGFLERPMDISPRRAVAHADATWRHFEELIDKQLLLPLHPHPATTSSPSRGLGLGISAKVRS
jgi:cytosine/adenosine deaminase-related metal-dependent hydrolase